MFLCLKTCSYVEDSKTIQIRPALHHLAPVGLLIVVYVITPMFHDVVLLSEQVAVFTHPLAVLGVPVRQNDERCLLCQSPAHPHAFLAVDLFELCALAFHECAVSFGVRFLQDLEGVIALSLAHLLPHAPGALSGGLADWLPAQRIIIPVSLAGAFQFAGVLFLDAFHTLCALGEMQFAGVAVQG